ncbi:MAG: MFS transporter, partial [Actinomycetota bacterium]|nr:MFS transporter [Actinomycetota bacterium]
AAAVTSIVLGLLGAGFGPNSVAVESVILLGIGQGAAFSLSIYYVAARAADARAAAELSGFSQAVGYLVAGFGPLLIGLLHTATGGWTVPLLILLTVAAGQMISGVLAGRNRVIGATGPVPASAGAT